MSERNLSLMEIVGCALQCIPFSEIMTVPLWLSGNLAFQLPDGLSTQNPDRVVRWQSW